MKKILAFLLVTLTIVLLGSIAAFAEVSPTATTITVPIIHPDGGIDAPTAGLTLGSGTTAATPNGGLATPTGAQVGTTSVGLDGSNSGSVRTTPDGSVIAEDVRPDSDSDSGSVRTTPDGSFIAEDVRPDNTLVSPKTGDRTSVLFLFSAAVLLLSVSALLYKAKKHDADIRFVK